MKRHVFVIGDLYVDHDIFVTELESRSDSGAMEPRFSVVRRQDTAGGAANTARMLSVLSDGATYLWGIVGSTHWGTFRGVLENSHAIDGVGRPIELRGVADETDPRMNTVTRILVVSEANTQIVQRRFCRYYDINQVHVPEAKREAVLYYLDRAQAKSPLHAIVINDFGRGTLTKPLIQAVAQRAAHRAIPLFVDPLFARTTEDRQRYAGIKGTAILPNLPEWCELVSDNRGPDYWRKNINDPETLREMAVQSFQHLGNFDYHVVKCDRHGVVLFFPHPDATKRHQYALYHLAPVPTNDSDERLQIGSGDVMTAAFAMEFPRGSHTTVEVLGAIQKANATVACYRQMPWHQMPSRREVLQKQDAFAWEGKSPDAEITKGVLFLPSTRSIRISTLETEIKGLFSQDQTFRRSVHDFMKDVRDGWTADELKSIVLGAPPGTGKTTIMKRLQEVGSSLGIAFLDMTSTEGNGLHMLSPAQFRERFRDFRDGRKGQRVLIFVDEALREPTVTFLVDNAPTLLNAAHSESLRFLFLSAAFKPEMELVPRWREFFRRTRTHYLSSLEERPFDIPYIIPARFFEKRPALMNVRLDGAFLLAVTDLTLVTPEPSVVCTIIDELLNDHKVDGADFTVTLEHLPNRYPKMSMRELGMYEFQR